MSTTLVFNDSLEAETLTDKPETKELPCRKCGRRCIVTRFASSEKTECTPCRKGQGVVAPIVIKTASEREPEPESFVFNEDLEPDILTDKEEFKVVPCRKCSRACVVTTFAAPSKVECTHCRGETKQAKHSEHMRKLAPSIDPSTLDNLLDAVIEPAFRLTPICPFDAEHTVELKSVTHSDTYGPRRFMGLEKGQPKYEQMPGESVLYQCNDCKTTISFSTMHQVMLQAQNEARQVSQGVDVLENMLGVRAA